MTDDRLQAYYAKLDKLRRAYVAKLPGRADELADAAGRWRSGEPGALERIGVLVHRLVSAGSFGFPGISEQATAIEVELEAGASHADVADRLQRLIASLRSPGPPR